MLKSIFLFKRIPAKIFVIGGIELTMGIITVFFTHNSLDISEQKRIDKFYLKKIGDLYNPIIADPVKNEVNDDYFNKNKKGYLKYPFLVLL